MVDPMFMNVLLSGVSGHLFRTCAVAMVFAIVGGNVASPQYREKSADEEIQEIDHRIIALLRNNLKKHGEAQSLAQQALDIAERASGGDSAVLAQRLDNLAFTIRIQHRYDEAKPLHDRALSIRERLFGSDSPDLCQSLTNIAVLHELKGDLTAAQTSLSRCLSLQERAFGADHPAVGHTLHMLAKLCRAAGRSTKADEFGYRAVQILGAEHPAVVIAEYQNGKRERDSTFLGQLTDYRWTGLRVGLGRAAQQMTLLGEATFNNGLWNLFEVELVHGPGTWRVNRLHSVPIHWKLLP
jgi:tetratricopeptide (TPR) repeat protein